MPTAPRLSSRRLSFLRRSRTDIAERFVGVPLTRAQPPPFASLLGAGLDARLFTDLSQIANLQSATSNEAFFVRTASPRNLPAGDQWSVRVAGLVTTPLTLGLRDLESLGTQRGRYLMECSGNSDPSSFGLISSADWDGVPLPRSSIARSHRLRRTAS
jgi:DMSO/TMAO reductase YedYZ molybdopterin-dependent catalytic subunit